MKNKILTILIYIIHGIALLPIIAAGLFFGIGASLFYVLYIINRVKYGPEDPRMGKAYKLISTILVVILVLALVYMTDIEIWSWQGFFFLQLAVFIGMLPISYYTLQCILENKRNGKQKTIKK